MTVPRATVRPSSKPRLLTKVRFLRRGRFLVLRARAQRTGMLRIQVKKAKRSLGTCRKRARSGRAFVCRIKLRRRASARGAKVVVSLLVRGKPAAVNTFRVPR